MWPPMVVPVDPVADNAPCVLEGLKRMLPDALFFETPKKPLDDAVLFRGIGCNEFLLQSIIAAGLSKPPTLKDQAIVAPQPWGTGGAERAEPRETGRLDGPLCLLGPIPACELVAHDFPIVTINDRGEMRPAVLPTRHMRHIHGPAFIAPTGPAHPAAYAGARRTRPLMDQPPLLLEHSIHRLFIDAACRLAPQQGPQMPIAERGILLNQLPERLDPRGGHGHGASIHRGDTRQARTADRQDPATPPLRDTR